MKVEVFLWPNGAAPAIHSPFYDHMCDLFTEEEWRNFFNAAEYGTD